MASAPTLQVARRDVIAVEHPMIVKNLDNALKTFGVGANTTGRPFRRVSCAVTCLISFLRPESSGLFYAPGIQYELCMDDILILWQVVDLEDPEGCIPLYLRYEDPLCTPILSHNSSTNNILLKITVPKRTGRKRKRGSQDPYSGDPVPSNEAEQESSTSFPPSLRSHSRLDNPLELLRTLKDNVGKYEVEAVAEIDRTHRFRGP